MTAFQRAGQGDPGPDRERAGSETRDPATAGEVVTGNVYDKYRTRNPVARYLQRGFLGACRGLLADRSPKRILEVGCGPGDLAQALCAGAEPVASSGALYLGCDLGLGEVVTANRRYPERTHFAASAYRLPFDDQSFDLVLCCEILEHLEHPRQALSEIARVASRHVLLTVPWEPVWRLMNLARGAYLGDLGNTPGHVQNYSRSAIRRLASERFEIVAERRPLPWTVLLLRELR